MHNVVSIRRHENLHLPVFLHALGSLGTYSIFAITSLAAVLGAFAIVPETANMTLEGIELMWGENSLPSFETASLSEWLPT